jgi:serine/threonine protein kinase
LLRAVAAQLAMAYENIGLKKQVEREQKYRRDVLSRVEVQTANLVRECPDCGRCYEASTPTCEHDGTELEIALPVERTLDGKYRLDRRIGSGGMGAVYEANDLRLSRQVAVKVVVGGEAGKSVNLKRFEREARASAQLSHPNIVTVFDYGAVGDEGAYLVMELLSGVTLRDEMRRLGRVPPALAAEWFEGVFDGMRIAHAAGVVHRDLKPENILIAEAADGKKVVKILDFGLAKVHFQGAPAAENLTVPGVMMGTFGYMPPEQLLGEEVDVRSDVFSLGVMVAEALTGKPPFDTKGWGALLMSIYRGGFRIESDLPEVARVSEILARALANDRAARYETVDEFQRDLIPALRACPPF